MASLPAYMRIRQYVIDLLRKHADCQVRIMSERELCSKFAVSRPTARRALKTLIDEGFLVVKPGAGTFINPAKVINHAYLLRKSFTVMVVVGSGSHTDIDGFFMALLAEIFQYYRTLPVNLRMGHIDTSSPEEAIKNLCIHDIDGILWLMPNDSGRKVVHEMRKKLPVYVLGDASNGEKCEVTTDYKMGGYLAASWFIDRELSKISFVGADVNSPVKALFYEGWKKAFQEAGIKGCDKLQIDMDMDIVESVKLQVRNNEIEGFFSFGSEFAALDVALCEMSTPADKYPVLIDENWYGSYGAQTQTAARILLFPARVARTTAEQMFKTLNEPGYKMAELVYEPEIITSPVNEE